MSRKKNLNYSLEDLLNDNYFHKWIIDSDASCDEFWENWMKADATRPPMVSKARKILLGIEFKSDPMPEETKARLWRKLESKVVPAGGVYSVAPKSSKLKWYYSAAMITLVAGALASILYFRSVSTQKGATHPIAYTESISPMGQKTTIQLADGSKVKLNASSSLKYPKKFSPETREVYLEGEAFFEVQKNSDRPFIVRTSNITVSVLGTSFNVSAYADNKDISVAVLTGEVMVENTLDAGNGQLYLEPREMAIYDKDKHITRKTIFDYKEILDWKDGVIHLKDANFQEIVKKLEKWFGVTFDVRREIITEKDFTGRFQNKSLEYILQGLSFSFDFDYEIDGKQIIIK
ncbi:FecR domain-containing protein [Fulvivirgaceae bacterium BMA10]|uniref:FecR domain-containing protein n=1 Tax=Splendidivirga corallicola TaxID=3051826 RepID=A0ABT8KW63_9BACT|nr:FecR domain-containing protein [Fulvivirgaceae bacterium BMA10]